jgi:16S rRNA (cytosine967-C5)-methyltransferase
MRLTNIYEVLCDGAQTPFAGRFDKVLLDAPCTATGIMHRHPEIRWRRTPDDIEMCAAKQSELLDNASRLVVRGGTLVYSVCSLEPEEGPEQVRSFLERHPHFRLVPPPGNIPGMYIDDNDCLSVSPQKHNMDGMFAARFERVAGSRR